MAERYDYSTIGTLHTHRHAHALAMQRGGARGGYRSVIDLPVAPTPARPSAHTHSLLHTTSAGGGQTVSERVAYMTRA